MAGNTHMGNDLEDMPQPDGIVTADRSITTAELSLVYGLDQETARYIRYVTLQIAQTVPHATVRRLRGQFVYAPPKAKRSRRAVALTSMAVEALRRHRLRQADMRSNAGLAWQDNGLVFTDALGEPLEGRYVLRHYFRPLLRRSCPSIIRFHDLRHTMARLLLAQGIPSKVVSEMLGHTTIGITLDLYSHVLPQMQREAATMLDRLLSRN